jgi:hypothetical protein
MSLRVRIMLTLAALLLLPAYSALAGAGASTNLQFSMNPAGGPPGTTVWVNGSGAVTGVPVHVMLVLSGDARSDTLAAVQADPRGDGSFQASVGVPKDLPNGRYAMRVEQRSTQGGVLQFAWLGFSAGTATVQEAGALRNSASTTVPTALAALLISMLLLGRRQPKVER